MLWLKTPKLCCWGVNLAEHDLVEQNIVPTTFGIGSFFFCVLCTPSGPEQSQQPTEPLQLYVVHWVGFYRKKKWLSLEDVFIYIYITLYVCSTLHVISILHVYCIHYSLISKRPEVRTSESKATGGLRPHHLISGFGRQSDRAQCRSRRCGAVSRLNLTSSRLKSYRGHRCQLGEGTKKAEPIGQPSLLCTP